MPSTDQLVPPAEVQDVVGETEQEHAGDRQESGEQLETNLLQLLPEICLDQCPRLTDAAN